MSGYSYFWAFECPKPPCNIFSYPAEETMWKSHMEISYGKGMCRVRGPETAEKHREAWPSWHPSLVQPSSSPSQRARLVIRPFGMLQPQWLFTIIGMRNMKKDQKMTTNSIQRIMRHNKLLYQGSNGAVVGSLFTVNNETSNKESMQRYAVQCDSHLPQRLLRT